MIQLQTVIDQSLAGFLQGRMMSTLYRIPGPAIPVIVLGVALVGISWSVFAQSESVIEVGKFSDAEVEDGLPLGWKPLTFKKIEKHTLYALIKDDGMVVVIAMSEASASGLIREISINPKEYPIVQW